MDKEHSVLKPSKTVAVIFYVLMMFLGSSFILIGVVAVYAHLQPQLSFDALFEICQKPELLEQASDSLVKGYAMTNAIGNMISYLLLFAVILFFMRDFLKEDGKRLKKKWRFYLCFIPLCFCLFYGLSFLFNWLMEKVVSSSENQQSIELMIENGGAFYMFIAVVLCAPLVEELIYRKAVFSFLERKNILWSYVFSILLFALPHLFTTSFEDPIQWFLKLLPYLFSALLLALIYHLSGKNIYTTWIIHGLNNLIAFLWVLF